MFLSSEVVARRTDGVPVLYMPHNFELNLFRSSDEVNKSDISLFLSKFFIVFPKENDNTIPTIKIDEKDYINMPVYFFDKICKYIDLYHLVSCLEHKHLCHNTFILHYLLDYAIYKKDIKLINHILKKIGSVCCFLSGSILEKLYEHKLDVVFPKEQTYILLFTVNFPIRPFINDYNEYILDRIGGLTDRDIVSMIFHDNIYLLIRLYSHLKTMNLIPLARRYTAPNILAFLYSKEKPIKDYVDNTFLDDNGIDKDSITYTEEIVSEGNLELIKKIYLHTIDIDYLNRRMILSLAVKNNDYEVAEFLIKQGSKIDIISCNYACYNGSVKMIELLINGSAVIESVNLYYAAFNGKLDLLKYIHNKKIKFDASVLNYFIKGGHLNINNIQSLENVVESFQDYILDYACTEQSVELETIEYLYQKNAKLSRHIMNNIASTGSLKVFRFFMDKGVPIDQHIMGNLATRGQFSLIQSMYNKVVPVMSLSGQAPSGAIITRFFNTNKKELDYTTIIKGIKYGNFEIKQSFIIQKDTQLLLTDELDTSQLTLECTIYNQLPPIDEGTLQTAGRHHHIDLVEFLISKKAPIDDDAMYDAIVRGYTDIVKMLYEYRPKINNYCLLLAKLWNRYDILKFFEDKPFATISEPIHRDYDLTDFEYYGKSTPRILYYACEYGNLKIIKQYVTINNKMTKIKTDFIRGNLRGFHDHTDMLYVAILNGHLHIVDYLSKFSNKDSKYIACAVRVGRMEILCYLVVNNYTICEKAIIYAIEKGRLEMVKYLVNINSPMPNNVLDLCNDHREIYNFIKSKTV